jgi:hypothetical protein
MRLDTDNAAPIICDPNSRLVSNVFLYTYSCWASEPLKNEGEVESSYVYIDILTNFVGDEHVLDRFDVVMITHKKSTDSPFHEFLIVKTYDRSEDCHRKFILERNTSVSAPSEELDEDSYDRPKLLERVKHFAKSLSKYFYGSPNSSPDLLPSSSLSMEIESLTLVDRSTVSLTESADLVSDSISHKTDNTPAVDIFLGANSTMRRKYKRAETIQRIKPKGLKLFQLVLLAHIVHELYPEYLLLRRQCFFFASVIVYTVEARFGTLAIDDDDLDEGESENPSEIPDTPDLNKSGRWRGFKVHVLEKGVIDKLIARYNEDYSQKIRKVCNAQSPMSHLLKQSKKIRRKARASRDQEKYKEVKKICSSSDSDSDSDPDIVGDSDPDIVGESDLDFVSLSDLD